MRKRADERTKHIFFRGFQDKAACRITREGYGGGSCLAGDGGGIEKLVDNYTDERP